jgi:hypothetical protein
MLIVASKWSVAQNCVASSEKELVTVDHPFFPLPKGPFIPRFSSLTPWVLSFPLPLRMSRQTMVIKMLNS